MSSEFGMSIFLLSRLQWGMHYDYYITTGWNINKQGYMDTGICTRLRFIQIILYCTFTNKMLTVVRAET